jgi:hypothetical protein
LRSEYAETQFSNFFSSTYIDLKEHRKAAEQAVNDLQKKFVGMEYLSALDDEPLNASLEMIDGCDSFIGISAWRYGHVPNGSDFSITELECKHAVDIDKSCFFSMWR